MADYERFIPYRAQSQDTGAAQVYGTLSDRLREFSENIYRTAVAPQIEARAKVAGSEAGAAGTPTLKSPLTLYGRAYNDAAVRAYALSQYADIEKNLTTFETEAGTDVGKFQAKVKGYREGALSGVIPEARSFIAQLIDENGAEASSRIVRAAGVQARETQRVAISSGLDTLAGKASKLFLSGEPGDIEKAQAYGQSYIDMVQASVADGTFTPKEGQALTDNHLKNSIEWLAAGQMETQYRVPGGNPVRVIQNVLANPALTDGDRQQLARSLYSRLDLLQRGDAETAAAANAQAKAESEAAERELTSDLFNGRLTAGKIDQAIRTRGLDPGVARTLFEKLKTGPGQSDDRERFIVESNILSYTEREIASNPRLDWDTKRILTDKRRSLEGGWPDTNNAQEARQRIDRAVGIVPGIPNPMLSAQAAIERGQAQTRWFELMQALPADQRDAQAITIANQVTQEVIGKRAAANVTSLQSRLAQRRKDLAAASGDRERAAIQENIKVLERKIAEAQAVGAK